MNSAIGNPIIKMYINAKGYKLYNMEEIRQIDLKINARKTDKSVLRKLSHAFVEAKWSINDALSSGDIFKYKYNEHRKVLCFDKDRNQVEREITLNTGIHQNLIKKLKEDIRNLHMKKLKGGKVGKLKYRREVSCLPIRHQGMNIKSGSVMTIPGFPNLKVHGLEQLKKYESYNLHDSFLLWKPDGFHIKLCLTAGIADLPEKGKSCGIDMGIKDTVTVSDGTKFDVSEQETEKLKRLQRHLARKPDKDSKRRKHLLRLVKREYQHISNVRDDKANKIVHWLYANYDFVYFQDEQLAEWKKCRRRGYGRAVQHSCLGRIKQKLVQKEGIASFKISKWEPTTRLCTACGSLLDMPPSKRIFACDCGITEDRDIHAAKNILMIGSSQRAERAERPSVENLLSVPCLQGSTIEDPLKRKEARPL